MYTGSITCANFCPQRFFSTLTDALRLLQVIHRPTFMQEVSELWNCVAEGNTSRIDPAWLSLYFMVLCWGATTLDPSKCQLNMAKYSKFGKRDVSEYWRGAAQKALRAAEWVVRPQIRTLQVTSYNRRIFMYKADLFDFYRTGDMSSVELANARFA